MSEVGWGLATTNPTNGGGSSALNSPLPSFFGDTKKKKKSSKYLHNECTVNYGILRKIHFKGPIATVIKYRII